MPPINLYLGLFFGALAAVFLGLALRWSSKQPAAATPARAYLRIGLIFAAVSLVLLFTGRYQ